MERKMFCFQCEQTAGCSACTGGAGVCGKKADTAELQDKLTGALIGLARAVEGDESLATEMTDKLVVEGLFTTITNVNFNNDTITALTGQIQAEKERLVPNCSDCSSACGRSSNYDMKELWSANEDVRSLKSLILFGIRGMAAYAYHADVLGYRDAAVNKFFYKALWAIGMKDWGMEELLPIVMEVGEINLKCMALLDKANTETYGNPAPTEVSLTIEKGPFIVISGHDLYDLKQLLEQTEGKGINIYTHGEMESYADRVFTTEVVSYPELIHIGENKDFTPVIEKALSLGGYPMDMHLTGINGGQRVMTGFAHNTVLSAADTVIKAVKSGDIKHFFLVGGCDGAKPGRNYYTEFVKQTPKDSIVLTLACGKYRFNDLNLGTIGELPRIMDMGQCNDAYSAIKVASALAEAFGCSVNDLPLSIILSWYEQKAVCVLLTLLHLGIKNILIGPSLPAFISPKVLNFLVENYNIALISTPEEDLKKMLG